MTLEERDQTDHLQNAVFSALEHHRPVFIRGGDTKAFYGRSVIYNNAVIADISAHSGILSYEPTELVMTARAGTPLTKIEATLAKYKQKLAFEPPRFGHNATLGGTVACGFSGPSRPFLGSVRDSVLGCRMINGKGECLTFGGQVMKNVAGFDVSRLMVGAMGTLGVLLEVSFKVLPVPECERTFVYSIAHDKVLDAMARWCGQPWPLTGLAYSDGCAFLRVSGAESALKAVYNKLGGECMKNDVQFWKTIKEQEHPFFLNRPGDSRLWRLSVPPAVPICHLSGKWFYDWAGAQRWLWTDAPSQVVFSETEQIGGHATLFRNEWSLPEGFVFQPLAPTLMELHHRIKYAFDPRGICNPGRMYESI